MTPGYDRFTVVASHIGSWILAIAVTVLVADIIAMVIYTIRHGKSDSQKGKVISEKRPLSSMSRGLTPQIGLSRLKILAARATSSPTTRWSTAPPRLASA